MTSDEYDDDDDEFNAFLDRGLAELVPKVRDVHVTAIIVPRNRRDMKVALELGVSIMLGKPLVLVVEPGVEVPEQLALIAEEIVEFGPHVGEAIYEAAVRIFESRSEPPA